MPSRLDYKLLSWFLITVPFSSLTLFPLPVSSCGSTQEITPGVLAVFSDGRVSDEAVWDLPSQARGTGL